MFWRGSETIFDSGTVTLRPLRVRRTKLSQAGALVPPEAAIEVEQAVAVQIELDEAGGADVAGQRDEGGGALRPR